MKGLRATARALAPLFVSALISLTLWVAVLKVWDITPLIGKTPQDVWVYLTDGAEAAAHRQAVLDPLFATLRDGGLGFVGGMIAALVVGVLFAASPAAEGAFMPVALILRSVPLVAMTPLIVLLCGRGPVAVTVIGAVVVFFPALVTITHGLRSVHQAPLDLVAVYGGGRWARLVRVQLPHAVPDIVAAAKLSVPGCLVGALVAEWLATGKGLGGSILRDIGAFGYAHLWASITALTFVSVLLYTLLGIAEQALGAGRTADRGRA